MRAFVTGATGFIGGALAAALANQGWEVRVLVRPASRNKLANPDRYHVVEGRPGLGRRLSPCGGRRLRCGFSRRRHPQPLGIRRRMNIAGPTWKGRAAFSTPRIGQARRFVLRQFGRRLRLARREGIDESFPTDVHGGAVHYHSTKAEAESLVRDARRRHRGGHSAADDHLWTGRLRRHGNAAHRHDRRGQFVRVGRGDEPRSFHLY